MPWSLIMEWLPKVAHAGNTLLLIFIAYYLAAHIEIEGHPQMVMRQVGQELLLEELVDDLKSAREESTRNFAILSGQITINSLMSERRDIRNIILTTEVDSIQEQRYQDRLNDIETELDVLRRNQIFNENGFQ